MRSIDNDKHQSQFAHNTSYIAHNTSHITHPTHSPRLVYIHTHTSFSVCTPYTHVLSCLHVCHLISSHLMSYHVIPCHVMSCHVAPHCLYVYFLSCLQLVLIIIVSLSLSNMMRYVMGYLVTLLHAMSSCTQVIIIFVTQCIMFYIQHTNRMRY